MYNIYNHALQVIFYKVLNGTKSQDVDMEKWYNEIMTDLIVNKEQIRLEKGREKC